MTPEATPEARPEARPEGHVARAMRAALWSYGARGVGLFWTLLLVGRLGIGAYGQYAMGFALAAVLIAPIEYPFSIRGVRGDLTDFLRERSARVLICLLLLAVGLAAAPLTVVVWFGLLVSAGELAFNAVKAQALRDARPHVVQQYDAARQATSVAAGTAYLLLAPAPTLAGAVVCYLLPYVVPVALAVGILRSSRPRLPRPAGEVGLLATEALGFVLYTQADVLLIGVVAGDRAAGYFAICWIVSMSVGVVGQTYAATFYVKLRSGAATGLPVRTTALLSAAAGGLVVAIGLVLLVAPVPTDLAVAMTVMGGFAATRTVVAILTTVLVFQRRDAVRTWTSVALVPLKAALLLGLCGAAGLGATGAAVAALVTDLPLVAVYARAGRERVS